MVNMMKLMKQASSMQKDIEKIQKEVAEQTVEFSSGGGMVKAIAKGDMSIDKIQIDPKVVDASDVEMLEDLILTAVAGALKAAKDHMSKEMEKVTGGVGLPFPGM